MTDERTDGLLTLQRSLRAAAGQLRQYGRLAVSRLFGTVASTDGRYKAIVDIEERSLFVRAEASALARVLLDKGVVTKAELTAVMVEEYQHLVAAVGKTWPELRVEEHAIHVTDLPAHAARARREGWPK